MNPQISLTFDAKHHGLHKDIYELFCHSQEAMGLANSDKERISFLWRDLLRVFLNLPVHYLYGDKAVGSFSTAKAKSAANPGQDDMDVEGDTKNESAAAARLALPPAMKGPLVSVTPYPLRKLRPGL